MVANPLYARIPHPATGRLGSFRQFYNFYLGKQGWLSVDFESSEVSVQGCRRMNICLTPPPSSPGPLRRACQPYLPPPAPAGHQRRAGAAGGGGSHTAAAAGAGGAALRLQVSEQGHGARGCTCNSAPPPHVARQHLGTMAHASSSLSPSQPPPRLPPLPQLRVGRPLFLRTQQASHLQVPAVVAAVGFLDVVGGGQWAARLVIV